MINRDGYKRFKFVYFYQLSDYENLNVAIESCKEDFVYKTDELIRICNYEATTKNYNYFNNYFTKNLDIFDMSIIKAQIVPNFNENQ